MWLHNVVCHSIVCGHTMRCATALCEPHCLDSQLPCASTKHLLSCRADAPEPEYRSIVWATAAALRLAGRRVLTNMETKKMLLQSLVALMSTPHAKHTDPALLLEYLLLVKNWLLEPQGGGEPAALSTCVNVRVRGGHELEGVFKRQMVGIAAQGGAGVLQLPQQLWVLGAWLLCNTCAF